MLSGCRPYSSGPRMMFLMEKSNGLDCCAAIGSAANSRRRPDKSLRIKMKDCCGQWCRNLERSRDCGQESIVRLGAMRLVTFWYDQLACRYRARGLGSARPMAFLANTRL